MPTLDADAGIQPADFPPSDYATATDREWLVTNGIGGFAASTLCGANTRRYHGLFVPAIHPPTSRMVFVSKIEETLVEGDGEMALGTNRFPGVIHPEGYRRLTAFRRMPVPEMEFRTRQARILKSVFMRHGLNVSVVTYTNAGDNPVELHLRPLLVYRDYHHLQREEPGWPFALTRLGEGTWRSEAFAGCHPLYIRHTSGSWVGRGDWYRNFLLDKETYRGLDDTENAFCVGMIRLSLDPGASTHVVFALAEEDLAGDPDEWMRLEQARQEAIFPRDGGDPFIRDLAISGDQFLVRRGSGHTILAGYPWFTDWGRDTMIAMRGLVIATGQQDLARSIFRTFLSRVDGGMIPNRFPDAGEEPEYNTIDATLWLFVSLYEHVIRFDDREFVREALPILEKIVVTHQAGTRYAIRVTDEGLLAGGESGVQLTWMDALVDGHVVTPRQGCPVEVNALWYNALCILREFRELAGEAAGDLDIRIRRTGEAFRRAFIHPLGYLYDVVQPDGGKDPSIRPNMIYAVSLPFSPLGREEAGQVLAAVEEHLYTPLGLRSLSPADPAFVPAYGGDPWTRDHAYHQGTVWAYLWGEWALAFLRHQDFSVSACQAVWERAGALREHYYRRDGLYALSEIFDGGQPVAGRGCPQQAWSVGMLLRVFLDPCFRGDY